MNKLLLTFIISSFTFLSSQRASAQAHSGKPNEQTPAMNSKTVPRNIQRSFDETMGLGGLIVLDKPKWIHQNGLYTVTCRATGDYGPGACTLRFKPYGGLVLFAYEPDEAPFD